MFAGRSGSRWPVRPTATATCWRAVRESWMNSPGHRADILDRAVTQLGGGVHTGEGGPWWTRDFGTGR
ncbi:CAP domain-containing protein [Streptomyces sp. NPDC005876]|uniref:CAP domain-containing protein n=1 Tax=Streptomyces sp. NPDC005876 TaxID=3157076 RepID=UPI0034023055